MSRSVKNSTVASTFINPWHCHLTSTLKLPLRSKITMNYHIQSRIPLFQLTKHGRASKIMSYWPILISSILALQVLPPSKIFARTEAMKHYPYHKKGGSFGGDYLFVCLKLPLWLLSVYIFVSINFTSSRIVFLFIFTNLFASIYARYFILFFLQIFYSYFLFLDYFNFNFFICLRKHFLLLFSSILTRRVFGGVCLFVWSVLYGLSPFPFLLLSNFM